MRLALDVPVFVDLLPPEGAVLVKPWAGEALSPGCLVWRCAVFGDEWVVFAPAAVAVLTAA